MRGLWREAVCERRSDEPSSGEGDLIAAVADALKEPEMCILALFTNTPSSWGVGMREARGGVVFLKMFMPAKLGNADAAAGTTSFCSVGCLAAAIFDAVSHFDTDICSRILTVSARGALLMWVAHIRQGFTILQLLRRRISVPCGSL